MAFIHVTWNKIYSVLILMFRTQLQLLGPFLGNSEKHIECMKSNRMLKILYKIESLPINLGFCNTAWYVSFVVYFTVYNKFNNALLKHHQIKFYTKKGGGGVVTDAYQRIYFNQIDVIHSRCFSELCRTGPRRS